MIKKCIEREVEKLPYKKYLFALYFRANFPLGTKELKAEMIGAGFTKDYTIMLGQKCGVVKILFIEQIILDFLSLMHGEHFTSLYKFKLNNPIMENENATRPD